MHTCYLCKPLPLSYPDDNIPTSAPFFVYDGAFDIACSVRNVSGCTLLCDVKLACNKHSNIARSHSLDFTQILVFTIY